MNLKELCKQHGVKYVLVAFVDLFGVVRSKLVPASAAESTESGGAAFAGFATHLDLTPAHPDIFVMPDPSTFVVLPWKPEVAWVTGDVIMDKAPIAHAPRNLLKRLTARAKKLGFSMNSGVEAEFFLLNQDGTRVADGRDVQSKPCYDQVSLMRNYGVIDEVCRSMETLGWKPYQNDHEDGNGQFEMNWHYTDALTTADRHVLFKIMVRNVAEKNELRATFMPKPFRDFTGNGCHVHVSLWDEANRRNLFESSSDEMGLSETAYHFMGGVLAHAKALSALTNPTVNSYKRLNATMTTSGATWSPNRVSYTGNNRTHMIRIPDGGRFEFRLADGSANPYLLQAGLLAAGLHGIEAKLAPGKRIDENMYEWNDAANVERLPGNLLDALRALEADQVLRKALGEDFVGAYLKLRQQDWNRYMGDVSDWERANTLDC